MSEMIERVARQIFETNITVYLRLSMDFSEQTVSVQEQYRGLARAAIKAMRDLTKPMMFYGMDAMARDDLEPTEAGFTRGYQAAIDAALNEEGKG